MLVVETLTPLEQRIQTAIYVAKLSRPGQHPPLGRTELEPVMLAHQPAFRPCPAILKALNVGGQGEPSRELACPLIRDGHPWPERAKPRLRPVQTEVQFRANSDFCGTVMMPLGSQVPIQNPWTARRVSGLKMGLPGQISISKAPGGKAWRTASASSAAPADIGSRPYRASSAACVAPETRRSGRFDHHARQRTSRRRRGVRSSPPQASL